MYVYDARFQTRSATFATRTRDGTNLTVVVAVRFRAVRRNMPLLHKYIGPDYVERLILPGLGARVREAIAFHTLEEVYSTKRLEIQMEIRNAMRQQFQMDPELDTLLQRVEFLEIGEVFLHDVEVAGPGCTSDRASGEMQPTGL